MKTISYVLYREDEFIVAQCLNAEVSSFGATRDEAIGRMEAALAACVVDGVKTTIPFLRRVMAHPDVRRGMVHTQMVEQGAFNA